MVINKWLIYMSVSRLYHSKFDDCHILKIKKQKNQTISLRGYCEKFIQIKAIIKIFGLINVIS